MNERRRCVALLLDGATMIDACEEFGIARIGCRQVGSSKLEFPWWRDTLIRGGRRPKECTVGPDCTARRS